MINAKLIGKRIKEVRTAKKMPQMLLAEKCDISVSYLSYIECGRKTPSLEVIIKIARELDTTVDSLLEGNQNTDTGTYEKEIAEVMDDCSPYEKRVLFEMLNSLKVTIRQNRTLIINEVKTSIKAY
jgi:transcriptional regulator with XRE-family HTH domain